MADEPQQTRLSVLMSDDCETFIRTYMARHGVSATEATRRAFLALQVHEDARNDQRIVQVCERTGKPLYEVILP